MSTRGQHDWRGNVNSAAFGPSVCVTRACPIVLELTPYYPDPLSSSQGSVGPYRIFQGWG